jgi:RNA polymerase sigma-70 factor (ECF subfamily)
LQVRWRHRATRANGQLAVGCYAWDEEQGAFRGHIIDVLTLRDDGQIAAVTAFIDAGLFERFGLPPELPA